MGVLYSGKVIGGSVINVNEAVEDIIQEMFTAFHRRENTLICTKDIEEVYNSLSYVYVPDTSEMGIDYATNRITAKIAAGDTIRFGWNLPKFTPSVYLLMGFSGQRYRRIKLINTDTGDYYEIEAYPPAVSNDNRIYKYVSGVKSSNINIRPGMDLPAEAVMLLSWDSRTYEGTPEGTTPEYPDTLLGFVITVEAYASSGNYKFPFVMRDTDIKTINKIEIEFYNDSSSEVFSYIGHGYGTMYYPITVAYD